jgi:flagellar basal-body rod protein FlgG
MMSVRSRTETPFWHARASRCCKSKNFNDGLAIADAALMDVMFTTAAAGLRSRTESLDILANNLSNAHTTGFKSDREQFTLYRADDVSADSASRLPLIEQNWVDHAQGTLEHTGDPANLALTGDGFLVVRGPSGDLLTRNGTLRLTASGQLQTQSGYPLVNETDNKPIVLDTSLNFEVDPAGRVFQSGQQVAKIKCASAADLQSLRKQGGSYFQIDATALKPAAPEIRQGFLESANVAESESSVQLIGILRQFETLQRAIALGGEMNRKSIEEVAKT